MNRYQKKHNTTNKLEEQLWQYIYIYRYINKKWGRKIETKFFQKEKSSSKINLRSLKHLVDEEI